MTHHGIFMPNFSQANKAFFAWMEIFAPEEGELDYIIGPFSLLILSSVVTVFISSPHILSSHSCNQSSAHSLSKNDWWPHSCYYENVLVLNLSDFSAAFAVLYFALHQGCCRADLAHGQCCYVLQPHPSLSKATPPTPQLHNVKTTLPLRFFSVFKSKPATNLRNILNGWSSLTFHIYLVFKSW